MPAKPDFESASAHLTRERHPGKSSCLANLAGAGSPRLAPIHRLACASWLAQDLTQAALAKATAAAQVSASVPPNTMAALPIANKPTDSSAYRSQTTKM